MPPTAWVLVLAALGEPKPDPRDSGNLELSWSATPPCSSQAEIENEVARLLEGASGPTRELRAQARLAPIANGGIAVELRLEVAGKLHLRSFEAESCQAAKSAVSLILAITMNPGAGGAAAAGYSNQSEPGELDSETIAAPAEPRPTATVVPTSTRSQPERARRALAPASTLSLGLAGLIEAGALPSAGLGGELQVIYQRGHLRAEAGAAVLGSRSARAETSGAGARLNAVSGRLRGGWGWELDSIWIGPFASAGLRRVSATGFGGSARNLERAEWVPELGAGGLLTYRATRWLGVRLSGEASFPTLLPKFVVVEPAPAPSQVVHQSSRVIGSAAIGLVVQFL